MSETIAAEIRSLLLRIGLVGKGSLALVADEEIERFLQVARINSAVGPIIAPTGYRKHHEQQERNEEFVRAFRAWRRAVREYGIEGMEG